MRRRSRADGHFLTTAALIAVFLAGLALLLYPTLSNLWNSFHQSAAIACYAEEVQTMDQTLTEEMLAAARSYNERLGGGDGSTLGKSPEGTDYRSVLNINDTGIMGYIEIPKLGCSLPIYHGTDEAVLQVGVGHIEGSSLPVGGEGTHCVLSGHRGLPSARLFTDLDRLEPGDVFRIRVLDQVLSYEVDRILIVLPEETQALEAVPGCDYCTLVTCTPYGVNTHRLLVRGHRIEETAESRQARIVSDAVPVDSRLVALFTALPLVLLAWAVMFASGSGHTGRKKRGGR